MPKGDDALIKKKNKSIKSSKFSNRIAAIITQKPRRHSTKRKMNQKQNKRKANENHGEDFEQEKESTLSNEKPTKNLSNHILKKVVCPSHFLLSCLQTIDDMNMIPDNSLYDDSWGFEYFDCYSSGKHVLETRGSCKLGQVAWIASIAVDTITTKKKEGVSFTNPYLLFLVPSQEKSTEVRSVCKHFKKAFGIHTVSLHPGASIDHQVNGLKTCEPEFIVSTPDRLLELVSMNAIDIAGVSSLVIDGLESSTEAAYIDSIKSIQKHISVVPHTVVFSGWCRGSRVCHVSDIVRFFQNQPAEGAVEPDEMEYNVGHSKAIKGAQGEAVILHKFGIRIDAYKDLLSWMARIIINRKVLCRFKELGTFKHYYPMF